MAEQEPSPEVLAQIAAENEDTEISVNYKPPAVKTLQEIQELDQDDESLRKYKEALLGKAGKVTGSYLWLISTENLLKCVTIFFSQSFCSACLFLLIMKGVKCQGIVVETVLFFHFFFFVQVKHSQKH